MGEATAVFKGIILAAALNRNLWVRNPLCFTFSWASMKSHHFLAALQKSWGDEIYSEFLGMIHGTCFLLLFLCDLVF